MGPRPVGRFPARERVRKRSEYQEIQSEARRVSTPRFVLLVYARADATGARLGVVVSRRVGNAVVRNRTKRLIREAFRATRDLWPPDIDVVVVARRPPGNATLEDVVGEWRKVSRLLATRQGDARRDLERRATSSPA
jgi:ribonuclease P protein component